MSSRYEKNVTMEEEGSYHRLQVERTPPEPQAATSSKSYTTKSYEVVPAKSHAPQRLSHNYSSDDDNDNFEEWTTSKRKVNHKTRQVETRVLRNLLIEDGKVIAESGPQVTTRIKEDNHVEECEKEKTPKHKSKFEAIENAPEGESSGRVLGEKKEIQKVSREVREENMQYHDERFKELTGHDVHRKAIKAPHELITINDDRHHSAPRGKMVHYSSKGKKYQDTDTILEVAKLAIDGSITKEVKRTKHHEELSDDEKPDDEGEAEALRQEPIATRSTRRGVDYVNDFDDTSTPSDASSVEEEDSRGVVRHYHSGRSKQAHGSKHSKAHHGQSRSKHHEDEAFPRYQIDPLLNSLNDDDFRPASKEHSSSRNHSSASGRYKEHPVVDKNRESSDEYEHQRRPLHRQQHRSPSPYSTSSHRGGAAAVEIPEEYRVNKQRLRGHKSPSGNVRERSFSPTSKSHLSHASQRSSKSHKSYKEDASVQAHLTDEEVERKSLRSLSHTSSSDINSHEKTTRHLQRNSTNQSKRNYYFGEKNQSRPQQQQQQHRKQAPSVTSSSSSSLSDPKERLRKQGARSKDSGFRSPNEGQQIYSVSSKSKKHQQQQTSDSRAGAISPTPTAASLGQRSVKTTTTTMSAGLTDRPASRSSTTRAKSPTQVKSTYAAPQRSASMSAKDSKKQAKGSKSDNKKRRHQSTQIDEDAAAGRSFDTISLSSLGPNATTIKVPYQPAGRQQLDSGYTMANHTSKQEPFEETGSRLGESIEEMRKRLEKINGRRSLSTDEAAENEGKRRYEHKIVVANVQPTPIIEQSSSASKRRLNHVDAYNVKVIEHNSPFHFQGQPVKSVNDLSNSIARLEELSSALGATNNENLADNNNEANFNLSDFVKKPPLQPATFEQEADSMSLGSSCSLRSSRTYNIRPEANQAVLPDGRDEEDLNDEKDFPVEMQSDVAGDEGENDEDAKKPAAWIFDIKDGSSTAIVAPPRPKQPELPKIDSRTEDLAQSKGGRSYYLELIEKNKEEVQPAPAKTQNKPQFRPRPSSIDSLYSRWNSHSTLITSSSSSNNRNNQQLPTKSPSMKVLTKQDSTRKSRQMVPASLIVSDCSSSTNNIQSQTNTNQRRQLPLSNRSKSSSCLASVTRPSKYSIYGGLKRPNEDNKPVPRLSYSRAIGPKSQRQLDAQSKTPSRYLKLK